MTDPRCGERHAVPGLQRSRRRQSIETAPGPVITHRGARVGVAGGFLHSVGRRCPPPRRPTSRLPPRPAHHHALRPRQRFIGPAPHLHRGHLRRRRQPLTPPATRPLSTRGRAWPTRVIGSSHQHPTSSEGMRTGGAARISGHFDLRRARRFRTHHHHQGLLGVLTLVGGLAGSVTTRRSHRLTCSSTR